jgi:hypothetical protein
MRASLAHAWPRRSGVRLFVMQGSGSRSRRRCHRRGRSVRRNQQRQRSRGRSDFIRARCGVTTPPNCWPRGYVRAVPRPKRPPIPRGPLGSDHPDPAIGPQEPAGEGRRRRGLSRIVGLADRTESPPGPPCGVLDRVRPDRGAAPGDYDDAREGVDSGHRYRRWRRAGGDVAELTGLVDLTRWPAGMRVIVRHQRPHPRAQLSISEECDGYRYQAFVENTSTEGFEMSGTPCKRVAENVSGSSAATRQRRAPPRRAGPIAAFPAAGDFGCNLAAEMLRSPGASLGICKRTRRFHKVCKC